jgi:hypothetical protein
LKQEIVCSVGIKGELLRNFLNFVVSFSISARIRGQKMRILKSKIKQTKPPAKPGVENVWPLWMRPAEKLLL